MGSLDPRLTAFDILAEPLRALGLTDRAAIAAAGRGADGAGRARPGAQRPLPDRVLRRPAAADRDRPRAGHQPVAGGARRAGVRAGRLDPGRRDQPAERAQGRAGAVVPVRGPRPVGGAAHLPTGSPSCTWAGSWRSARWTRCSSDPRHPYTEALLSAIPVPDPQVERTRERVLLRGDLPSPTDSCPGCRFVSRCPLHLTLDERPAGPLQERDTGTGRRIEFRPPQRVPLPLTPVLAVQTSATRRLRGRENDARRTRTITRSAVLAAIAVLSMALVGLQRRLRPRRRQRRRDRPVARREGPVQPPALRQHQGRRHADHVTAGDLAAVQHVPDRRHGLHPHRVALVQPDPDHLHRRRRRGVQPGLPHRRQAGDGRREHQDHLHDQPEGHLQRRLADRLALVRVDLEDQQRHGPGLPGQLHRRLRPDHIGRARHRRPAGRGDLPGRQRVVAGPVQRAAQPRGRRSHRVQPGLHQHPAQRVGRGPVPGAEVRSAERRHHLRAQPKVVGQAGQAGHPDVPDDGGRRPA